jgi:hypothetical protein
VTPDKVAFGLDDPVAPGRVGGAGLRGGHLAWLVLASVVALEPGVHTPTKRTEYLRNHSFADHESR